MNLSDPAYSHTLREIGSLCNRLNLQPVFLEPETPPGPRRIYSHADHISQLIENYKLQIRPSEFSKWRALSKARGNLDTFDQDVWILCTDGTVAWYITWSGTLILGQLANFTGPISYWAEDKDEKEAREVKEKQAHEDRLDEMLKELLGE